MKRRLFNAGALIGLVLWLLLSAAFAWSLRWGGSIVYRSPDREVELRLRAGRITLLNTHYDPSISMNPRPSWRLESRSYGTPPGWRSFLNFTWSERTSYHHFPYIATFPLLVLPLFWLIHRFVRPEETHLCPACGYDLRGSPGSVCPECGAVSQESDREPDPE